MPVSGGPNKSSVPITPSSPSSSPLLSVPSYAPRPSITLKYRPDGTRFRPISPLEAIYYHERLDLITHPLIKGLIKWKWDHFAGKRFYVGLALELLFLISWTSCSLLTPFPVRYVYRFPQDLWRCILWAISIGFLVFHIVQEILDITYARNRYEDYLIWESDRTRNQLDLISKKKSNVTGQSQSTAIKKSESIVRVNSETGDVEHVIVNETTGSLATANPVLPTTRSHHSQHHPLPPTLPTIIKGKQVETPTSASLPIDSVMGSSEPSSGISNGTKKRTGTGTMFDLPFATGPTTQRRRSRLLLVAQNFRERARRRLKTYYMYYSLNNLFDWIIYILCILTLLTHFIDVSTHTVIRARIHMYTASITVLCMWFRFMVFFRTIIISVKTLRSKMIEIKLGELVIMVCHLNESLNYSSTKSHLLSLI